MHSVRFGQIWVLTRGLSSHNIAISVTEPQKQANSVTALLHYVVPPVIPSQRDAIILNLLRQNGVIAVAEVSSQCNCSAETARRDLRRLEEQGEVARTHGGAVLAKTQLPVHVRGNGSGVSEARTALVDRADCLIVTAKDSKAIHLLVERGRRAGLPIIAEATGFGPSRWFITSVTPTKPRIANR